MEGKKRFSKIGRTFKLGIIGMGEGKGLAKGITGHPEIILTSICDVNKDLVEAVQVDLQVPKSFTSYEAMLEEDLDIVAIYTPDHLHIQHIRMAFATGKHVICTKPLVNSVEEAKELLEIQQTYPEQKLLVGQSSRFFSSLKRQHEVYDTGKFGTLNFVDAHYVHDMRWFYNNRPWTKEESTHFDFIFACLSHPVDLVRWYLGDIEEVHAFGSQSGVAKESGFNGLDTYTVNLRSTDGKIGRVLGLYGLEHIHSFTPWVQCTLYGTDGTYQGMYPQLKSISKFRGEEEKIEAYFEDVYHYFQYEGINHHAGEFINYTEYFARSIYEEKKGMPNIEDGYKTIATLEAIRKSIQENRAIKLLEVL